MTPNLLFIPIILLFILNDNVGVTEN